MQRTAANAAASKSLKRCLNEKKTREDTSHLLETARFKHPKPFPRQLSVNVSHCYYSLVRKVLKNEFKMRIVEDPDCEDFDIVWADHGLPSEKLQRLKPHQRHSQLPGISCLARKNSLAQNLNDMQLKFPAEYSFYPKTYLYPQDR